MTRRPESKPPTAQRSGYIAGDPRLHYLEHGMGSTNVVLLHGIASCAPAWAFVAQALAASGRLRVITPDIRGRGLSEPARRGEYTLDHYAADVASLVRNLGLERPVVIGHSMGARIASAFAASHPELAGPLVLVEPPLSGPGREPYPLPLAPYLTTLHRAKEGGATADDMRLQFPTWTVEQLKVRARWLGACDEVALVESYANFHLEDFFASCPALQAPVRFVYGERSPVVPASAIPEVEAALPAAEIVCVAGAGHMIPWDNLDGFVAAVGPAVGLSQ